MRPTADSCAGHVPQRCLRVLMWYFTRLRADAGLQPPTPQLSANPPRTSWKSSHSRSAQPQGPRSVSEWFLWQPMDGSTKGREVKSSAVSEQSSNLFFGLLFRLSVGQQMALLLAIIFQRDNQAPTRSLPLGAWMLNEL